MFWKSPVSDIFRPDLEHLAAYALSHSMDSSVPLALIALNIHFCARQWEPSAESPIQFQTHLLERKTIIKKRRWFGEQFLSFYIT